MFSFLYLSLVYSLSSLSSPHCVHLFSFQASSTPAKASRVSSPGAHRTAQRYSNAHKHSLVLSHVDGLSLSYYFFFVCLSLSFICDNDSQSSLRFGVDWVATQSSTCFSLTHTFAAILILIFSLSLSLVRISLSHLSSL